MELFVEVRNIVQTTIKKKEKDYISVKLEENSKNPEMLWKTIKSLGLPSK